MSLTIAVWPMSQPAQLLGDVPAEADVAPFDGVGFRRVRIRASRAAPGNSGGVNRIGCCRARIRRMTASSSVSSFRFSRAYRKIIELPPVGQVADPAEGLEQDRFLDLAGHHRPFDTAPLEEADGPADASQRGRRVRIAECRADRPTPFPRIPTQQTEIPWLRAASAKAIGSRPAPASRPTRSRPRMSELGSG